VVTGILVQGQSIAVPDPGCATGPRGMDVSAVVDNDILPPGLRRRNRRTCATGKREMQRRPR